MCCSSVPKPAVYKSCRFPRVGSLVQSFGSRPAISMTDPSMRLMRLLVVMQKIGLLSSGMDRYERQRRVLSTREVGLRVGNLFPGDGQETGLVVHILNIISSDLVDRGARRVSTIRLGFGRVLTWLGNSSERVVWWVSRQCCLRQR